MILWFATSNGKLLTWTFKIGFTFRFSSPNVYVFAHMRKRNLLISSMLIFCFGNVVSFYQLNGNDLFLYLGVEVQSFLGKGNEGCYSATSTQGNFTIDTISEVSLHVLFSCTGRIMKDNLLFIHSCRLHIKSTSGSSVNTREITSIAEFMIKFVMLF